MRRGVRVIDGRRGEPVFVVELYAVYKHVHVVFDKTLDIVIVIEVQPRRAVGGRSKVERNGRLVYGDDVANIVMRLVRLDALAERRVRRDDIHFAAHQHARADA